MKKGGNIISFEVKGGLEAGRKFIDATQLCSLSANLGDSRSIITHPSSTTHSKLSQEEQSEVGITPGMIRLSVGLEHHEDIWNDLKEALDA
jgi:O-succinylhomoserine sulfhydrylase